MRYLQSLGGWDASMLGTFDPDTIDRISYGYYDPVMETARAGALGQTMSSYGGGFGDVLDPAAYEELIRQQMASGLLDAYQGVQGQQQAALGQTMDVKDEWAQLMAQFGLDPGN